MRGSCRALGIVVALLGLLIAAMPAGAQVDEVYLEIDPSQLGLDGVARYGAWSPARLLVDNRSAAAKAVRCEWLLRDVDGDAVVYQRRATLNPNRQEIIWLYAAIPADLPENTPWVFQVVDAETDRLLARKEVVPRAVLHPSSGLTGVMSTARLGFDPYIRRSDSNRRFDLQHEPLQLVRGLTMNSLPDRWYGLSMLDALVWTSEGGDPTGADVTVEMQQAVREYVQRGGHLVVILPTVGQTWTSSPLADMLPVTTAQVQQVEGAPPEILGPTLTPEQVTITYNILNVPEAKQRQVLATDGFGRPVVVAGRYGFGTVTVMGVDLADRRLVRLGLPRAADPPIWNRVLHWQSPVMEAAYMEDEIRAGRMVDPGSRRAMTLSQFIPREIAMRSTTAPVLLLAILLFGIYWLLAGPISFVVLRAKGKARHSWLLFVAIVGGFAVLAWGGAWLLRPHTASIEHFSVLDIDARTSLVNTRSWFSLYLPTFGEPEIAVDPDDQTGHDTLSSQGIVRTVGTGGFFGTMSYRVDAADPDGYSVPFRSTAKQFELDYFGRIDQRRAGLNEGWALINGQLRIDNFWPVGELWHDLPGTLEDVVVIYAPGGGRMPWVWRHGSWEQGERIRIEERTSADLLVNAGNVDTRERRWREEGFLGTAIANIKDLQLDERPEHQRPARDKLRSMVELLTFYSALPPPNYRDTRSFDVAEYHRGVARVMDLTSQIAGRRLIILGHLADSPLPAPLAVNGRTVSSRGWTVVRWIHDFD